MIGKLFAIIIGITFVGLGIWWNKKYHNEKFVDTSSASTGSFLGDIMAQLFMFLMGILPWYVFKTVLILFGTLLIYEVIIS
ncbi:hypothetical protein [Neobacillus drentensis]|uniref:hypothetical protein n=1 Tax=Neobacillus drentensis TaxID=220684 RepID=UPI002FFF9C54